MMEVMKAVKTSNNDVGGRKFEMSNMAYIVRGLGYKTSKMWKKSHHYNRFRKLKISVLFKWVGFTSRILMQMRRSEVVGGIVVMRYGENADKVIDAVKLKMKEKDCLKVTFKPS
jgi:Cu(I)/Ag(I) efflux system membrane protein CusA/SilA